MKAGVFLQKGVHKAYKISRDAINRAHDAIFSSYQAISDDLFRVRTNPR